MFDIELSAQTRKFLKKADRQLAVRLIDKIDKLSTDPFPTDVKRVVNRKEKIFRVRVGDYRIQYSVFYNKTMIFVFEIDKRPRAY